MDKKNIKLVPRANFADHRQVTETFSITLSGIFLPTQIIYQGITKWSNHWSNEEKAIQLIEKVLLPYVRRA